MTAAKAEDRAVALVRDLAEKDTKCPLRLAEFALTLGYEYYFLLEQFGEFFSDAELATMSELSDTKLEKTLLDTFRF